MGSKNILRIGYLKTSALATLLGKTISEGDEITEAEIKSVSITWQEIRQDDDLSKFNYKNKPLENVQNGARIKDKFSQKGFYDISGSIRNIMQSSTSTTHKELLKNGFGTLTAGTESSTIVAVTSETEFTVATGTFNVSAGDVIKIGSNNKAVVKSLTVGATDTIEIENPVSMLANDTVVEADWWNPQTLEDPDESYLVLIESSNSIDIATFCRWGIDLSTTGNQEFLSLMFNFQGDYLIKDLSSYTPSYTSEPVLSVGATTEFSGITVDGTTTCFANFDLDIKRPLVRKKCRGTQMRTGNGGTFRDVFTTELKAVQYSQTLDSKFEANTQFEIIAQKGELLIYAPKSRVVEQNILSTLDDQQTTEYKLYLNTDMSTDMKISL